MNICDILDNDLFRPALLAVSAVSAHKAVDGFEELMSRLEHLYPPVNSSFHAYFGQLNPELWGIFAYTLVFAVTGVKALYTPVNNYFERREKHQPPC